MAAVLIDLYEYGLPVNFTRTSSSCAGRDLYNTKSVLTYFTQTMMYIWRNKLCHCSIVRYYGCAIIKISNNVLFLQSIHSIRFHWRLSIDSVQLCAYTSDYECSTHAGEACASDRQPLNGNPDSYSCPCEHSLGCVCMCWSLWNLHRMFTYQCQVQS